MTADFKTVRVLIAGDVQGVWYRSWTVETARSLNLCGWVRNRWDGTVEAMFRGSESAVEIMLARCHGGPSAAQIDSVTVAACDDQMVSGFCQLPTV